MKQLLETTVINLILALALSASAFAAKPVMRVADIKGDAFQVQEDGSTLRLQKDYHIEDLSQVMVGETSQVTVVDYNENTYHLAPATQVKIVGDEVHLTQGNVWVESTTKPDESGYKVLSPNGVVKYKSSNFIYSYNNVDGKSQVFVIKGQVDFYNRFETHYKYEVESGKFSFIENKYEEGHPRVPTNLGFNSFQKVTALFKDIKMDFSKDKNVIATTDVVNVKRKVASVENLAPKTGVLFISSKKVTREPNSLDQKSIKKFAPKRKPIAYKKTAINYYGMNAPKIAAKPTQWNVVPTKAEPEFKIVKAPVTKKSVESVRVPSSIPSEKSEYDKMFQESLKKNYKQQEKHPEELNNLIDELESYSNEFKKTYY